MSSCLVLARAAAEYLELLDWTGRQLARGKRGAIPAHLPPILERTGIAAGNWLEVVSKFGRAFHRVAGGWRSVGALPPGARRFRPGRAELLSATS